MIPEPTIRPIHIAPIVPQTQEPTWDQLLREEMAEYKARLDALETRWHERLHRCLERLYHRITGWFSWV